MLINAADRELTPAPPCAKKRRVNWGAGEAVKKLKEVTEYLQQNPSCSLRSAAIDNDIPESVLRRHVTKMKNPEGCTRGRGRPPRSNCPPASGAKSSESNPMLQAIAEYKQGDHKPSIRSAAQHRDDRRKQKNRREFLQTFKKDNPDYVKKFGEARVKGAQSMKYETITTNIDEHLLQPALDRAAPFFQKLNSIRMPTPQNAKKSNIFDATCKRNESKHIECNGKNCYYDDKGCSNRRSLRPYLTSCRPRLWPQNDNKSNQFELCSMEKIPQGVFIGQYVGRIRKRAESTNLGYYLADFDILVRRDGCELNLRGGSEKGMDTYRYLVDGTEEGNLTRFANHCCEPNCEMQVWLINEKPQIWVVSLNDIKKDESITFDYGPNAPNFFEDGVCKCLAECCKYKEANEGDVSHLSSAMRTKTDTDPSEGHVNNIDSRNSTQIKNLVTIRPRARRSTPKAAEADEDATDVENLKSPPKEMIEDAPALTSTVEIDKAKITNSPKAPIPGIGLQNLGNSCYLSASLQTIFSLPQFIDKLYSTYSKLASPTKKMPLTQALLEVAAATGVLAEKDAPLIDSQVARSKSGISATLSLATANPVGLKRVMDVLTDKFAGYEQRDAHEFLSDLVDFLHDELAAPPSAIAAASTAGTLTAEGKSMDENKNPNPAKETVGKCEKEVSKNGAAAVPVQHASCVLPTDEYFHLNVRVCLKCDSCGYSRSKDEMYRHLSVDVGEDSNLEKWTVERSLKQFFKPEKREIKCEKCDSGKSATQTMAIISCPKALLLHFKRFIVTQEMKSSPIARPNSQGKEIQAAPPPPRMEMVLHKNKAKIPIEESLSINSFIDKKKECPAGKYFLRGVVHHVGSTAFKGHYTTCAKRNLKECNGKADYISNSNTANKEQWVFFDDRVGTKKSTDYVTGCERNQRNCYMALYELKAKSSARDNSIQQPPHKKKKQSQPIQSIDVTTVAQRTRSQDRKQQLNLTQSDDPIDLTVDDTREMVTTYTETNVISEAWTENLLETVLMKHLDKLDRIEVVANTFGTSFKKMKHQMHCRLLKKEVIFCPTLDSKHWVLFLVWMPKKW